MPIFWLSRHIRNILTWLWRKTEWIIFRWEQLQQKKWSHLTGKNVNKNKLDEISDLKLRKDLQSGQKMFNQNINKVVKTEWVNQLWETEKDSLQLTHHKFWRQIQKEKNTRFLWSSALFVFIYFDLEVQFSARKDFWTRHLFALIYKYKKKYSKKPNVLYTIMSVRFWSFYMISHFFSNLIPFASIIKEVVKK